MHSIVYSEYRVLRDSQTYYIHKHQDDHKYMYLQVLLKMFNLP